MIKVTVVQLPDPTPELEAAFAALVEHTKREKPDLVLLPEMPFYPWVGYTDQVDPAAWQAAVDAHEEWLSRLPALGAAAVLGTRPVLDAGVPFNDAFVWQAGSGAQFAHRKHYLPNEPGFWEATWYRPSADARFEAAEAGGLKVGFMICSDLWFGEHARGYARQGIHILANPRATEAQSVEKWIAGGTALAVMSGAYCISSNRAGAGQGGVSFGGGGWVIDPDGKLLARTSAAQPFVTVEIDPARAEAAKLTYPRDVKE
jgi:N-carbamoylputrescine amidase